MTIMCSEKWDAAAINSRSYRTSLRIASQKEWLRNIDEDPKSEQRWARQECVVCFYTPRICGQGFTGYKCAMCGRDDMHSNTCIPKLCLTCATENELCRNCGADENLVARREEPPDPPGWEGGFADNH